MDWSTLKKGTVADVITELIIITSHKKFYDSARSKLTTSWSV